VDLGFEDETFGLYQQVTLTPLDLLASVITPIFAAYCGTLYLPWLSTTPALG
jgi:hypothetical protein